MPVDAYEPWEPKVGDRIRIRISPECQFDQVSHKVIDGATGTVVGVSNRLMQMAVWTKSTGRWLAEGWRSPTESEEAHRVRVQTDPSTYYPSIYNSTQVLHVDLAVLEIEPLDGTLESVIQCDTHEQ